MIHATSSELFSDLIETTTASKVEKPIIIPIEVYKGGTSIKLLSQDELLYIFQYLTFREINIIGCVCKEWRILHSKYNIAKFRT